MEYFGWEREIGKNQCVSCCDVIFCNKMEGGRRKKGKKFTVVFLGKKSTERRFDRKVSMCRRTSSLKNWNFCVEIFFAGLEVSTHDLLFFKRERRKVVITPHAPTIFDQPTNSRLSWGMCIHQSNRPSAWLTCTRIGAWLTNICWLQNGQRQLMDFGPYGSIKTEKHLKEGGQGNLKRQPCLCLNLNYGLVPGRAIPGRKSNSWALGCCVCISFTWCLWRWYGMQFHLKLF